MPRFAATSATSLAGALFLLAVLAIAAADGRYAVAVYALSFWHYALYFLAYFYCAVPPDAFRRDAVAMKSVALAALGAAYLGAPPDVASLAVVAAGFLLNITAAAALGTERTYYGHELAGLPPLRVTAFPYSLISHPMLVGNVAAFGGTLLNAQFRETWWPLAAAHVALNLALLLMETRVAPRRLGARIVVPDRVPVHVGPMLAALVAAAGAAAGAATAAATRMAATATGAALGACVAAFACALYVLYTSPLAPSWRPANQGGDCP